MYSGNLESIAFHPWSSIGGSFVLLHLRSGTYPEGKGEGGGGFKPPHHPPPSHPFELPSKKRPAHLILTPSKDL